MIDNDTDTFSQFKSIKNVNLYRSGSAKGHRLLKLQSVQKETQTVHYVR